MTREVRLWICLLSAVLTGVVTAGAVLSSTVVASAQDEDRDLHIAALNTEYFPIVEVGIALEADDEIDIDKFTVREDGLDVPLDVARISEPLNLVLALDVSGSMAGPPLDAAKKAARACLTNLPEGSQAALISYADFPVVSSGFTADTGMLNAALNGLTAEGETATYDALWHAGLLIGPPDPAANATAFDGRLNRFVVLLSDGEDTVSSISQQAAIDALEVSNATVFAVAIESAETDHVTLNNIVSSTDGQLFSGGSAELDQLCTTINAQLANRYLIRYESAARQPRAIPAYVEIFYNDSRIAGTDAIALTVPAVSGSTPSDLPSIIGELPTDGATTSPPVLPTAVIVGSPEDALTDVPNSLPFGQDETIDDPEDEAIDDLETAIGDLGDSGSNLPPGGDVGLDDPALDDLVPAPTGAVGSVLALLANFIGSPSAVWAGAAMVGVAIALTVATIFGAMNTGAGTISLGGAKQPSRSSLSSLSDLFGSFSDVVDRLMNRRGGGSSPSEASSRASKLNLLLDQAGMAVRPAEIVAGTAAGTAVAVVVMLIAGFRLLPLVLLIMIPLLVRAFIKRKAKKRTEAFKGQLGDTLMIMAGSIRAGHSLMRSVSSVGQQSPDPTAEEFNRVLTETRIGRDPIESLTHLAERIGSEDLTWTVRAMALNRELGGNLAEVLDNVGETIRDRNHIADQVKALSSEGKFSAYVLFALPFIVSLAVSVLNRGYLTPLFTTTNGYIVLAIGGGLLGVGALWIRNLINLEY